VNTNQGAQAKPGNGTVTGRSRAYAVFTIVETQEEKALWRRVGSGFVNRDGSYNLYLDALPVNGRLHMRESDGNGSGNGSGATLNHERS
jgi:hypothetical protein